MAVSSIGITDFKVTGFQLVGIMDGVRTRIRESGGRKEQR